MKGEREGGERKRRGRERMGGGRGERKREGGRGEEREKGRGREDGEKKEGREGGKRSKSLFIFVLFVYWEEGRRE